MMKIKTYYFNLSKVRNTDKSLLDYQLLKDFFIEFFLLFLYNTEQPTNIALKIVLKDNSIRSLTKKYTILPLSKDRPILNVDSVSACGPSAIEGPVAGQDYLKELPAFKNFLNIISIFLVHSGSNYKDTEVKYLFMEYSTFKVSSKKPNYVKLFQVYKFNYDLLELADLDYDYSIGPKAYNSNLLKFKEDNYPHNMDFVT